MYKGKVFNRAKAVVKRKKKLLFLFDKFMENSGRKILKICGEKL
jgi:hypothetical protein